MIYNIAERFKSCQGEGVWTGTPMAFIRFVGCSVGKKVCAACDTAFEQQHPWLGGGEYEELELLAWAQPFRRVCLTGGEPLDQDLLPLLIASEVNETGITFHIETSGTKPIWPGFQKHERLWLCVSPKPGFRQDMIALADEVKVIVPGLGPGEGWPSIQDALHWADSGKVVFLQPKNLRNEVDPISLSLCLELVQRYPVFRLSVQTHKLLRVR